MDSFIATLIFLPTIAVGALGGAAGALIVVPLVHFIASRKARNIATALAAVVAAKLAIVSADSFKPQYLHIKIVNDLKDQRIYSTIFNHYPGSQDELRSIMKGVLANTTANRAFSDVAAASANFVNKYVQKHLPTASDAAIHNMFGQEAKIFDALTNFPSICIDYFMEDGLIPSEEVATRLLAFAAAGSDAKAEIIESSAVHPSISGEKVEPSLMLSIFTRGYKELGYPAEDMMKIADIRTFPAAEGCRLIREYANVMAAMDEREIGLIVRSGMSGNAH